MTEAAAAVLTSSYWTSMTVGRGIYTAAAAAGSSLNCAALGLADDMPLMLRREQHCCAGRSTFCREQRVLDGKSGRRAITPALVSAAGVRNWTVLFVSTVPSGLGRIVVSGIEAPNLLANLVWKTKRPSSIVSPDPRQRWGAAG